MELKEVSSETSPEGPPLPSPRGRRWYFVLVVVLFILFACLWTDLHRLRGAHHFRQAHTAMTARNYARVDLNFTHPMIDGITYGKDLYLNEFPLYPWILGVLWRVFGESIWLARLGSMAFAVVALWYFLLLVERLTASRRFAAFATGLMAVTPVFAYFGQAVQRQSLFLACLFAGTHYLLAHIEKTRWRDLAAGTLTMAVAIALNPFAVYMVLPLAVAGFSRDGVRFLRRWPVLLAALLCLVPTAAWYGHALAASKAQATSEMVAITTPLNQRDFLSSGHYAIWFQRGVWSNVFKTFMHFVTPGITTIFFLIAGLVMTWRDPRYRFFRWWFAAAGAYALVDFYPFGVVVHHYYYLNLVPVTSVFVAAAVVELGRVFWRRAVGGYTREEGGTFSVRFRADPRGWLIPVILLVGIQIFYAEMIQANREMKKEMGHSHKRYYNLPELLPAPDSLSERLLVLSYSECPLVSFVVSPVWRHRLVHIDPQDLDALSPILAKKDYDRILLVCDPEYPATNGDLQAAGKRITEITGMTSSVLDPDLAYLWFSPAPKPPR